MAALFLRFSPPFLAVISSLLLTHCQGLDRSGPPNSAAAWPERVPKQIAFARDVKPILEVRCLECHNSSTASANAGLNLETRRLALTTGRVPPVIRPGDPENSLFLKVLQLDLSHPTNMPPAPDKVTGVPLKILERWIAEGAEWPEQVRLVPLQYQ